MPGVLGTAGGLLCGGDDRAQGDSGTDDGRLLAGVTEGESPAGPAGEGAEAGSVTIGG